MGISVEWSEFDEWIESWNVNKHTKKMDRDISLDAIKLVACIFVCTLHTIGMFMSESSDFHLSYLLFYMSGIAVPLFFMVNGFLLAPKDGGIKYYYRKI